MYGKKDTGVNGQIAGGRARDGQKGHRGGRTGSWWEACKWTEGHRRRDGWWESWMYGQKDMGGWTDGQLVESWDVWRERHGWTDGWMAGGELDVRTEGHRGGRTPWMQSSELRQVLLVHILCPLHPESDWGRCALVSSLSQRNRGPERHSPPLCQHSRGVPCTRGAVTVAFARPLTVLANESHRVRPPPRVLWSWGRLSCPPQGREADPGPGSRSC